MPSFNNGSIEVQISGGYAPYTYTLYRLNASNNYIQVPNTAFPNFSNPIIAQDTSAVRFGNPSDDPTANIDGAYGIAPGTYKIVVFDQSEECIAERDGIIVTSFEQTNVCLEFEDPNNYTISVTDTTSGLNNGTFVAQVPNDIGTIPYGNIFLSSSSGPNITPSESASNAAAGVFTYTFNNLAASTYQFNISDAGTCSFTSGIRTIGSSTAACTTFNANINGTTVGTPSAPTSSGATNGAFQVTVPLSAIGFAANEITVSASGSASAQFIGGNNWNISGPAGSYQVTITSNNGCTYTLPSSVTIPPFVAIDTCAPFTSATITAAVQQDEQVLGDADGIIRVTVPTVSGFNTATGVSVAATSSGQSTVTGTSLGGGVYELTGLAAGSWAITASIPNADGGLCSQVDFATLTINPGAAAPVPLYYFHGSAGAWPYTLDLTNTTTSAILPTGAESSPDYDTASYTERMQFVMGKAESGDLVLDPFGSGGQYTIQSQDLSPGSTASNLATTSMAFPASGFTDEFYIILPTSFGNISTRLSQSGQALSGITSQSFTYDGTSYTIYKLNSSFAGTGPNTIEIN
jgi:hypothetical protein